eukprot:5621989-Heterocapsa_arctica.AAC.1
MPLYEENGTPGGWDVRGGQPGPDVDAANPDDAIVEAEDPDDAMEESVEVAAARVPCAGRRTA